MEEKVNIRPTKKQKELLSFIESFIAEHGYSPSVRDLMQATDITGTSMVAFYLDQLQRRGYIRRDARIPRSITVLRDVYEGE